jgi:phytanoyl-CoA hydroxylase
VGARRQQYHEQGFVYLPGFFPVAEISALLADAKDVFLRQMRAAGIVSAGPAEERDFEAGMARFFQHDQAAFINCGKTCQHLIRLHRLALGDCLLEQIHALGLCQPVICTRPVLYFNSRRLARSESYYKSPPHQDWRSMQGSLNALVVWVPLVDIDRTLGALEIIPGSHTAGLQPSVPDDWYRRIEGTREADYVAVPVQAGDALIFSAFLIHRSGDNVTDSIRWSCHFRYNDLAEPTFVARKYPNPYLYKPQQELITPDFPDLALLRKTFSGKAPTED